MHNGNTEMTDGRFRTMITNDAGIKVEARMPVIVSASRSTDIPAFYADWFFNRLDKGYSAWVNPFNGARSYICYDKTRFIVFWSKNPKPLLPYLSRLRDRGIGCYIQYTLNDYADDGFEPGLPALQERIDTFKRLVDSLGPGAVVWRFDPLLLTDTIGTGDLLEKIEKTAKRLSGYTEKLVFSYADIASYRKVRCNLARHEIAYREWDENSMLDMATRMSASPLLRNLQIATCCERIDLEHLGIGHNSCIDDELIARLSHGDEALMQHLGMKIIRLESDLFSSDICPPDNAIALGGSMYACRRRTNRDTGQREHCGCITAKDIGSYNTCPHLCMYCYANSSEKAVIANHACHMSHPFTESII